MKHNPTSLMNHKNTTRRSRAGTGLTFFKGLTLTLVMALVVMGCDSIVDQNAEADINIATSDISGVLSVDTPPVTCIDPAVLEYNKVTDSKTVEWGNKKNPFTKTVDIEYYNTLTEFVLRVTSSEMIADVLVDDESIKDFDGTVEAGTWQEFRFDLDEGDTQTFSLTVAGSGPPAYFEVNYTLLGECITACGEDVTFNYGGVDVTYGTVTGANDSCWLDRNLGASQVAETGTDAEAYGDYFTFDQAVNACPVDFRLATEAEWKTERQSWSSNNATGAFASPLKLPVAGFRDLGSTTWLYDRAISGYYWLGSVDGTDGTSWNLFFNSSDAGVYPSFSAYGYSVRCIKD